MKKHFLILMLMALLPMAGWAADIEVKVYGGEMHFNYGAVIVPTTAAQKAEMFVYLPSTLDAEVKELVAAKLQYTSTLEITSNAGTYNYTFSLISSGDRMVTYSGDNYVITVQDPNGSFVVDKLVPDVTEIGAGKIITAAPEFVTEDLSYTGQAQSLLKSDKLGTTAEGFTLEYSVDGTNWAADGYKVTNANTTGYTVYYRTAENTNYSASASKTVEGTKAVAKGTPSITTVPTLVAGFTYNGLEKAIIATPGAAKIGDITLTSGITYQLQKKGATDFENEGTPSTDPTALKVKNIGEYRIEYSVPTTDPNLNSVAAATTASMTIAPATLTYSIDAKEKVYGTVADPTLTVTYSGFVGEETDAVVTVAPALTRATGENAGSYDITVTNAALVAATNYVVTAPAATAGAGKFTITPKPLSTTGFTFTLDAEPAVYTGSPITKTVATAKFGTTDMTYATDYSYVCTNNVNAGTANVIISGQGNFKGTVIVPFTIDPAPIYIKPANASKIYGADDPNPLTTYTLVNAAGNPVEGVTLNGTPTITRVAGENVGVYTISVTGYAAGAVADNYAPTALDTYTALFTINAAGSGLELRFKAGTTATKVYDGSTDITALAYSINDLEVVDGLVNGETWEDVMPTLSTPTFTLKGKDVDTENNQVTVTNLASTNYPTVTVQPLAFTVTERPITVTVVDQAITYGAALANATYGTNWSIATATPLATGDNAADLGLTLKTVNDLYTYGVRADAYEDAITAVITNKNYDLTVEKGNLTVNAGTAITLNREGDMDALISAYDDETINVTLDRNITRTEAWFAMVLPFETSVTELSQKYGYAVVNVLNTANDEASKVKFKLHMQTIPANTPFLIKIATAKETPMDFGAKHIAYVADPESHDAAGNKFHGVFKTTELDASNYLWVMVPSKNKFNKLDAQGTTLTPINAYLETKENLDAFAPVITVEDFDFNTGTTSIKVLNAETMNAYSTDGLYNLNGMKMQGVPTQKGVYIQNGKKVVIK